MGAKGANAKARRGGTWQDYNKVLRCAQLVKRSMVGRRARERAPWGRGAPGARLRGRVRIRRRRPTAAGSPSLAVNRPLCGQDTLAEEVKRGTTIGHPLDALQAIDLPFDLAV